MSHDPDRYMRDLLQIMAQGKKKIGFLFGAGVPASIKVNEEGKTSKDGKPLLPLVKELTEAVKGKLDPEQVEVLEAIKNEIGNGANIEKILSHIRSIPMYIGDGVIHGMNKDKYILLSNKICSIIGEIVGVNMPEGSNSYSRFSAWVGGIDRTSPIEIFTTNYDLLFEEALEEYEIPYFDGFSGSNMPFFETATISKNDLPMRWVRLWKLHGSLGWDIDGKGKLTRGKSRAASWLIYPDHMKYDQIKKYPYTAFFDHFRTFLSIPDTMLLSCGFSFADAHVSAVIEESLAANPNVSVMAFQYGKIEEEQHAKKIAQKRSNMSVYGCDGAVINGIQSTWELSKKENTEWESVRKRYWGIREEGSKNEMLLGDFSHFVNFLSVTAMSLEEVDK